MSKRKIDDLLTERHRRFTPLQKLLRRAADQEVWTAQFQALLPEPLSRDCRITDIRGEVAVVVCRNAASATRLRFLADDLQTELAKLSDFRGIRKLQIRVSSA